MFITFGWIAQPQFIAQVDRFQQKKVFIELYKPGCEFLPSREAFASWYEDINTHTYKCPQEHTQTHNRDGIKWSGLDILGVPLAVGCPSQWEVIWSIFLSSLRNCADDAKDVISGSIGCLKNDEECFYLKKYDNFTTI